MFEITQPSRRMDEAQAIRVVPNQKRRKKRIWPFMFLEIIFVKSTARFENIAAISKQH
jgi:hypothetical protein